MGLNVLNIKVALSFIQSEKINKDSKVRIISLVVVSPRVAAFSTVHCSASFGQLQAKTSFPVKFGGRRRDR